MSLHLFLGQYLISALLGASTTSFSTPSLLNNNVPGLVHLEALRRESSAAVPFLVTTSSPYTHFVLANMITHTRESVCQMRTGFDNRPFSKGRIGMQISKSVWMITTSLHEPSPSHLSSLQCFHFPDTATLVLYPTAAPAVSHVLCHQNSPCRRRTGFLDRTSHEHNKTGSWKTHNLTLTGMTSPTARMLRTITVRTTEATDTAIDTRRTTIDPHDRTQTLMGTGDTITISLTTSMATATVLITHCTAKAITRVHMEELVGCTQKR